MGKVLGSGCILGDKTENSIQPAFARMLGVTSGRLCRDQEAREALLLARAWADGLVLEDGAELGASVERLREQYGQLLAVGVIGPTGSLQALYPERPEYGRLVAKALDPTVMLVSDPGGGETVWRVVVPVDVDSGPTARGLLVLFPGSPSMADGSKARLCSPR